MKLQFIPLSLLLSYLLTGCQSTSVLKPEKYQAPELASPAQYRYATAHSSQDWAALNWVQQAQTPLQPVTWWLRYQDSTLTGLMQQLNADNLSLQQAEARYRQAMALLSQQQAMRLPTLGMSSAVNREGAKSNDQTSQYQVGLKASWVPDLWGRVAQAIAVQQAHLQASGADRAAIQLNQQLLLAQAYWQLRGLDQKLDVLAQTHQSFKRAYQILQDQYQAGMIARADVIQAETQLKQVELQQTSTQRQRALQQNIMALLLGKTVSDFDLKQVDYHFAVPEITAQIPSRMLSQRPDVLHAERALAASHAELGLAQTAWLPDISIGLDTAMNSQVFSALLQSPHYLWSTGLQAVGTLFDGGKRRADIAQAQARYDEHLALYKQRVLTGWKEVESALLQSQSFSVEAEQQQHLRLLAVENERVVQQRYQAGMISYLEVVVAQNLRLQAEQKSLELQQRQMQNSAELIAALGGHWDRD